MVTSSRDAVDTVLCSQYLLITDSTQEDRKTSQHVCKTVDWGVKHLRKPNKQLVCVQLLI